MAVNLVHNVGPMFHKKRYHEFPNYEGRAMSFILYTLKLLFGLDGQTELQLSRFACDINQTTHENMFVFSTWLRHIEYRKIVLAHQHFPTSFQQAHDNASRMNLFTNFLRQHKGEESLEHNNLTKEVVNKVLTDLEICENSNVLNGVDFPYDRCPTSANLTTILQKCGDILVRGQPLQKDILCDFSHCNLDYVFNSNAYLQKLPHKTDSVVRKGARQHCVYTDLDLSTDPRKQEKWKEDFQRNKLDYLYVDELENFVLRKKLKPDPKSTEKIKSSELNVNQLLKKKNTEQIVGRGKNGRFCPKNSEQARQDENYHNRRRRGKYFVSAWTDNPVLHEQTHNSLYEATGGRSLRETAEGLLARKRSRTAHHRPDRELWMLCVRPTQYPALAPLTRLHWRQLRDMLSPTFRAVLAECAQVCGHKQRHLYREFALVEMYVNYVHLALPATAQDVSKQIPALFPLW